MSFPDQVLSGQLTAAGWMELALKLCLVIFLIYVSAWLLKKRSIHLPGLSRWTTAPSDLLMHTLAVHPLTPGVSLYLVEVEKRRLLLSVSAQQPAQLLLDLGHHESESVL